MATVKSKDSFCLAAKEYLNDEKFSDFTIVCEGQEFKVHRCFIAAHSPYFKRCCTGMFEVSQQRCILLSNDTRDADMFNRRRHRREASN